MYYILHAGDPRQVWNWHRGEYCCDYDAEYGPGFGYATLVGAAHRASRMYDPGVVVSRKQLFEMLEVRDWKQGDSYGT